MTTVKIYKGSTEINWMKKLSISSSLTLKINAYNGTTLKETYTLKVEKEAMIDNNDDDIYLKDLSLHMIMMILILISLKRHHHII